MSAAEQTAGRGRHGRTWVAPPGRALLCSVIVRELPRLLPLAAGLAVADTVDDAAGTAGAARVKWPNDVWLDGRKVAGILVEGRPQEGWGVVGIGLNVALRDSDFPPELTSTATTLGLGPDAIEPTMQTLLAALERWVAASSDEVLDAVRSRDALLGQPVRWADGSGHGGGIDGDGRLIVLTDGGRVELEAGEVHLLR